MSPSRGSSIDIEALSGICGSISIACWVVVFSPQIIENFRRSSAEGLSLSFIVIWLAGDVFNILGAVLQGVLPTMIILAIYYTVADLVLLGQCFYYKGFTLKDEIAEEEAIAPDEERSQDANERTSLLPSPMPDSRTPPRPRISDADRGKRSSFSSIHSYISAASASNVDATYLSPATPFIPPKTATSTPAAAETLKPTPSLKTFTFNTSILIVVCGVGVLGWWLSTRSTHIGYLHGSNTDGIVTVATSDEELRFDLWGQIFGYLCAVLYLGSRIPQILLNQRRKSTEGVSMLFFIFACVGNATYVMSIFAYEPACAGLSGLHGYGGGDLGQGPKNDEGGGCLPHEWAEQYGNYIAVNASWLIGSAGTLVLDLIIFAQFWIYRDMGSHNETG
ncbi:uncharacterized protein KY384_005151 [Bacidia gigantensis]|uniref:uncharacterized protein n=1 Tax=Bacidia gigantensis TaxID=2732470 RepID=UPI001D050518|nr:uncharacterized protein KY384_005151 [Bacidia gigantensis]KAG8529670.1 hypothetical protein KY384_005151 [Bacidia gigantensis]